MLSRVADSLYWMARYMERAENVARFLGVCFNLSLDQPNLGKDTWQSLVKTTGDIENFNARYQKADETSVIHFLTFDHQNPNSILSCLYHARENARSIRDVITSEMWNHINTFYLRVKQWSSNQPDLNQINQICYQIQFDCYLYTGLSESNMSHGEGWNFMRLGTMIERADKTTRILDANCTIFPDGYDDKRDPLPLFHSSTLLKSTSAFEMYRKTHSCIYFNSVVDFLILNREFPRSLIYCVEKAYEALILLNRSKQVRDFWSLSSLRDQLEDLTTTELVDVDLHLFLDEIQRQLNDSHQQIFQNFFIIDLDQIPPASQSQIQ